MQVERQLLHWVRNSDHIVALLFAIMGLMTRRVILAAAAALLAGCAKQAPAKRYPMQGEIKSLDPASKTANINAGKIEGFMEAMTMEYPVKPEAEFAKLHVGDRVQGTVVVTDDKFYVTDVKVLPKQ